MNKYYHKNSDIIFWIKVATKNVDSENLKTSLAQTAQLYILNSG